MENTLRFALCVGNVGAAVLAFLVVHPSHDNIAFVAEPQVVHAQRSSPQRFNQTLVSLKLMSAGDIHV